MRPDEWPWVVKLGCTALLVSGAATMWIVVADRLHGFVA